MSHAKSLEMFEDFSTEAHFHTSRRFRNAVNNLMEVVVYICYDLCVFMFSNSELMCLHDVVYGSFQSQ